MPPKRTETQLVQGFWSRIRNVDNTADCWEWIGHRSSSDRDYAHRYGSFIVERKPVSAHRYMWRLVNGPIPDGMCVLHSCDNPPCVNPDHLFLGTQTENVRDCVRKGRAFCPKRPLGGDSRTARGEGSGTSKLTNDIVRDILSQPKKRGVVAAMARKYGVHSSTVARIVRGERWTHLSESNTEA